MIILMNNLIRQQSNFNNKSNMVSQNRWCKTLRGERDLMNLTRKNFKEYPIL